MRTLDAPATLLDLLREAGDEPVTLDELEVVGVVDPATALFALEQAGHALQRVRDLRADGPVSCVRLAPPGTEPAVEAEVAPEPEPGAGRRGLVAAVLALTLLALVLALRRE